MLKKHAIGDIAEDIEKSFLIVLGKVFLDRLDVNLAVAPDAVKVLDIFDVPFEIDFGSDQVDELFVCDAIDGNVDLVDACLNDLFARLWRQQDPIRRRIDTVDLIASSRIANHVRKALVHQRLAFFICLLYTSPSPRDRTRSRMPSSA